MAWASLKNPGCARVIVGGSYWTLNGVNVFSVNLVRGLRARGIEAEILLTEEDTDLIAINDAAMARPADVPISALPVERRHSWGRHWGAMIRYLEDRAPCVYIPNSDWRHSCVSPLLSDGVRIAGVVHSDDPLHYDHVRRLGPYWDAIVTTSPVIARKTIALTPSLRERTEVIPIGVDIPLHAPHRNPATGDQLRVIYPGTLKQHQKRVLDLPKIVDAAARRNIAMRLTIAGGGPDEEALRAACAPLVDRGLITFVGVVEHGALLKMLEEHDVFIMTSEFEGMPNALLEAMGRGCVPLVTDIESGIPDLVKEGISGHLVPVGAIEAFADRIERLWRSGDELRRLSRGAYDAVTAGKFRLGDMVDSYAALCERLLGPAHTAAYRRPRGPLNHPPADIEGVGLFPVELTHDVPAVGKFPRWLPDFREFSEEIHHLSNPSASWLASLVMPPVGSGLRDTSIIVSAGAWIGNGINDASAALVRGLVAAHVNAHVLVTEEDTLLVERTEPLAPKPSDVPFARLPVGRDEGWGAHWGAMLRYLEDHAPCVYVPNDDWRHSTICPLLSDGVTIIGVVHDDPMHYDHARRLGPYWNAAIATETVAARRLAEVPALAGRVFDVPMASPDCARDFLVICEEVLEQRRTGAFRRPVGRLQAPPREVNGIEIFPLAMPDDLSRAIREYRDFNARLGRAIDIDEARLRTLQVIVASPAWNKSGVNDFSATLVRELSDAGLSAHIVLTEEDTELVARSGQPAPYPPDVRFERLPVKRADGWVAHWKAMASYLEEHAPCIYIPNHDWRHSCVCPILSDRVFVVGVMHGNDPLHDDHARRLGSYWNAAIVYNADVAHRIAADPELAPRAYVLPYVERGMGLDYVHVFDRVLKDADEGRYRRPRGTFEPPPREVAGCSLFEVELSDTDHTELAALISPRCPRPVP